MRPPLAIHQETYVRNRENPYFNGLLRVNDSSEDLNLDFDHEASAGSPSNSEFVSDVGDRVDERLMSEISEKSLDSTFAGSVSDVILEPLGQSTIWRVPKNSKKTSSASRLSEFNLSLEFGDDYVPAESISEAFVVTEGPNTLFGLTRPISKSYSLNKRKADLSKISLPQTAASFYNGISPQFEIVESCEIIQKLNAYLKDRKDDVISGVPGKFLHAVISGGVSDVESIASTIMYAFYLNETLENDQLCTVPVINMKREDLRPHAELTWLLDSCQIDNSFLIFVDEIDLSYYNLFGSLKIVLVNDQNLSTKQEALKEAVVEIFNSKGGESAYPWAETVNTTQDSCCTLVAEKFTLTSPEALTGQGFSRLLLAGILLHTGNLSSTNCTIKDKYMTTLLINGAGRFGCNGLYQILKYKMHDISDLKLTDILHKDFKKWKRVGKPDIGGSRSVVSFIGMSSIGTSIEQLLRHKATSTEEIKYFQRLEKLQILVIVSGYYDTHKNFKREILVSGESLELAKSLLSFFYSKVSELPLKALPYPALREEMKAFHVDKVTSRKNIERILEEFIGA
ncbi:hypothetical protein K2173_003569 [Erythroxylum novogranatense]|uniref:DHHA2 domain-containing protein n=1 Tax=Erythroxylum novogranatense TaxID=1862640 RepID=A0AAV8TAS3_9ROSI|nr:hypothetical protein K2173_003569 [Erythroxylum novogranatense]